MDYSTSLLIVGGVSIVGYSVFYAADLRRKAVKEINRLREIAVNQAAIIESNNSGDDEMLETMDIDRDERQQVELDILVRIKGLLKPNGLKALEFLEIVGLPQGQELHEFLSEACKLANSGQKQQKQKQQQQQPQPQQPQQQHDNHQNNQPRQNRQRRQSMPLLDD